jgi:type VI secretion system secreted protein VgrG
MTPTQTDRNVSIKTVLGPDALLFESANVAEQLGRLYQFEVKLRSIDHNIPFDTVIGTNATIRLELNERDQQRFFNGLVSRFVLTQVDQGYAHYRMTLVPWLWMLTRTSDCRIYQNKPVPEIIRDVFRRHNFHDYREALSGHYDPWEYCVQYRETDFNFVSRLMEHEGIYYFFEHEDGKHTLVLADGPTAHKPKHGAESLAYRPHADGLKDVDYISDFVLDQGVQPGAYALNDFNFKKPRVSLHGKASHPKNHAHAHHEIYDYPGEYEESKHGLDYSQIRIEELQAQFEVSHGQSSDRSMATGSTFTLDEFPREDWNKKYLITSTSIHLRGDDYESGGQSGGEFYSCSFTAIPATVHYRAPRVTPKPLIQGCQTAIVTGPKGQEIYVDEHARVKVKFHWDRHSKEDENSSCWIRVSQPWAGKGYGSMAVPRIGQEVIVDFLEGDPDLPIINGRVYNAVQPTHNANAGRKTPPPASFPQAAVMTSLKSQSLGGGGGHNEITMNDTAGAEGLYIRAQHDEIHEVLNDRGDTVGNNETVAIGNDQTVTIGNNQVIQVGNNILVTAGTSITWQCGAATIHMNQAGVISITGTIINISSSILASLGAPVTTVSGSLLLSSSGSINLSSGTLTHVDGSLLAHLGGGKAEVVGSGECVVKGLPVKLN